MPSDSQRDPFWAEWGRSLLRDHPDGLGKEPDFAQDGAARFIWGSSGFIKVEESSWRFGAFKDYKIGDRIYQAWPDSGDDQIYIAREMFKLAGAYWYFAKKEADEQAEKERQAALAAEQREDELARLSNEVKTADTIQQLEIRAEEIRERLRSATGVDADFLHRELVVLQNRLIELERENARTGWRWAVIGAVLGVIGIVVGVAFPVWDLMHRSAETTHQNPATKSIEPAQEP